MALFEYNLTDERARALQELMQRKRIEAGYKRQSDAAAAIGVSQDLISRLESRFTPNIRLSEFGRVLRAYGVSPNEAYEVLGLYDPPKRRSVECTIIEREIIPTLERLDHDALRRLKRVIDGFVDH